VEFRILGPLEVIDDGRTIELAARKPSALLAVLLLNANRVVPTGVLVEWLWESRPPGTAAKALQVYVSQLRKMLGRERIVTRSPGYELRIGDHELDADRFEGLIAGARYREALDLWRGPALADFAYEAFAQGEIARLEERRAACVELRIEADLVQGRHTALIGELEALVREHPLRERLRAQLMLALYRSGRQADALDVYQAGRHLLADELGPRPIRAATARVPRPILRPARRLPRAPGRRSRSGSRGTPEDPRASRMEARRPRCSIVRRYPSTFSCAPRSA
jgi:DNA-binding SARP family transcriptional activator